MIGMICLGMCACCQEELSTYLKERTKRVDEDITQYYSNYEKNKDDARSIGKMYSFCGELTAYNTIRLHFEDEKNKKN